MANDDDAPATKKDLRLLEARLDAIEAKYDAVEGRFDTMSEQMREMQTELLRAFMPCQQHVDVRFI